MSTRAALTASRWLERRTNRRGFLAKSAIVGSALAVAPTRYVLRPGTAEAAVCSCSGFSCDCGALCCDGYTEFCCTLTGANRCPSGTLAAGWWKADGSGYCRVDGVEQPRYYIDCNAGCGGCSCGSSGVCSGACSGTVCRCGNSSCNNRKAGCTLFRYGQCNQAVPCVGPIVCRVVTCTPPWLIDSTCTRTTLTDNNTRFHNRPCLQSRPSAPMTWRVGTFRYRNTLTSGAPVATFDYGADTDIPVVGDWNGDGRKTVGVFRDGYWFLRNANSAGSTHISFKFGTKGDIPVVGDWTGRGRDSVGVYRNGRWHLRFTLTTGYSNRVLEFGAPTDIPVVGDWNGDGVSGIGVVRGREWLLRQTPTDGPSQIKVTYGEVGDQPVVGDWNGDGRDSIGVVRENAWYLRNSLSPGAANTTFRFGLEGDRFLAWTP